MIIVRVELHSANTRKVTELARMEICNTGESAGSIRHYDARTLRGRSQDDLDKRITQRETEIRNWPSLRLHVWNLVHEAISRMGYSKRS